MSFESVNLAEVRSFRKPQPLPKPSLVCEQNEDIYFISSEYKTGNRQNVNSVKKKVSKYDEKSSSSKENASMLLPVTIENELTPANNATVKRGKFSGSFTDLIVAKSRRNQLYINDFISDRHKFVNNIYRRTTVEAGDNHVVKFFCLSHSIVCALRIIAFLVIFSLAMCIVFQQSLFFGPNQPKGFNNSEGNYNDTLNNNDTVHPWTEDNSTEGHNISRNTPIPHMETTVTLHGNYSPALLPPTVSTSYSSTPPPTNLKLPSQQTQTPTSSTTTTSTTTPAKPTSTTTPAATTSTTTPATTTSTPATTTSTTTPTTTTSTTTPTTTTSTTTSATTTSTPATTTSTTTPANATAQFPPPPPPETNSTDTASATTLLT